MKAHRRSLGALTAFLVCSTGAHGWEAFCRNQQFLREKNAIRESLSLVWQSTCSAPSPRLENLLRGVFPYAPECADGLEAARGSMLGEHRWITEKAMIKVGLGIPFDTGTYILGAPSIPYNPHDFHLYENNGLVLDYYLDGSNVVGACAIICNQFSRTSTTNGEPRMTVRMNFALSRKFVQVISKVIMADLIRLNRPSCSASGVVHPLFNPERRINRCTYGPFLTCLFPISGAGRAQFVGVSWS